MLYKQRPVLTLVETPPDLAAGSAEIHAYGVTLVNGHRLSLHGEPAALGQPAIETRPRLARVA